MADQNPGNPVNPRTSTHNGVLMARSRLRYLRSKNRTRTSTQRGALCSVTPVD